MNTGKSGCEWLKCRFWNGELCTDEEEFFNKAGERVCRMREDAISKNEQQLADLQAENANLRCCGNCALWAKTECPECKTWRTWKKANESCEGWTNDGMTKGDRQ